MQYDHHVKAYRAWLRRFNARMAQLANPFNRPLPTTAELTGRQYTEAVARFKK